MGAEVTLGTLLLAGGAAAAVAVTSEEQRKSASKAAANQKNTLAAQALERKNTKTAQPVPAGQLSEAARKNRRNAASFGPRGFAPPTLGRAGLLGLVG